MRLFDGPDAVPAGFGPSAVAIGKFDGVHLGHRAVLAQLRELADKRGLTDVVVTFDRNPLSILRPEISPPSVVSLAQKTELLAEAGVDATLVLTFDEERSREEAPDFVRQVLIGALHAEAVLCGADFRFGARGAGDVALLRELGAQLGFAVVLIEDVRADGDAGRISSTRIRQLLAAGRVREAGELLGRAPSVRSVVIAGRRLGHELGYPTANLDPERIEGLIPGDGVYACQAVVDGRSYAAAVSVGDNPTFEGVPVQQVEAHLIDQTIDLYGRPIELRFIEYVRPMRRFDGMEELAAALREDDAAIRGILDRPLAESS